jgi:hypothetical protein
MRECRECSRELPLASFTVWRRNRSGERYQTTRRVCRGCVTLRNKQNRAARHWDGDVALMMRDQTLRRKYGVSVAQYDEMLAKQGGGCAICRVAGDHPRNRGNGALHVDHDHKTGRVRGILCATCNTALGTYEAARSLGRFDQYLREDE